MSDIKNVNFFIPNVLDASQTDASSSNNNASIDGASFSDILKNAINNVDDAQHQANTAVSQALNGEATDLHDTMIALRKADTSLKMMQEVRNKLLAAYEEVIKTQM